MMVQPLNLRPVLSLFRPPDEPDETLNSGELCTENVEISAAMRLSQFFRQWFVPIVLAAERDCQATTVGLYEDSIGWWIKITGDPPLSQIDEFTLALYQQGLRTATFRRGLSGSARPLSRGSQVKHLRNIRAVLHRLGPTLDANRPAKELLPKTPHLRVPELKSKLKPCFNWAQCQAMIAATEQMTVPRIPGISPRDWWRGRLACHLYTGLRSGTIRRLTWEVVQQDDSGQHWLEIPAELVTKTQKETRVIVHPTLLAAIQATRRTESPSEPLSVQPHCSRWVQELHERLQNLAGIPEAKWLSPHAWRRTHSDQLAQLGLAAVADLCRSALDHADARTTTGHYVDVLNKFRLKLPALW